MKYAVGDSFLVQCDQACGNKKNVKIFGTNIYSSDSSLCKAAVHSKVVANTPNTKVQVKLVACPPQFESKDTETDPI